MVGTFVASLVCLWVGAMIGLFVGTLIAQDQEPQIEMVDGEILVVEWPDGKVARYRVSSYLPPPEDQPPVEDVGDDHE